MKKALAYFFSLLLILLVSSVFLVSCKTAQPTAPDLNTEKTTQNDSLTDVTVVDNNKAIIDSLSWQIAKIKTSKKDCDSLSQDAVNKVLKSLNAKKQSGDNSYELKYNALKRQFDLIVKIGATKNVSTTKKQTKNKTSYRYITKTITVQKPLPKWKFYLMLIGGAAIAFTVFRVAKTKLF